MKQIVYNTEFGIKRNIQNLHDMLGVRMEEVAYEAGMSVASARAWVSGNFRTATGSKSKPAARVKSILDRYFIGGVPELGRRKDVDLFKVFKCEQCQYKMRPQKGCYKFGYSKEDINRGAYVHLLSGEGFFLGEQTPCPYAGGR